MQQRNPAFVGRDTALVELRDQLLAGGTAVARALHGMGGVGKTQLAVEYAYRFSGTYDLVWWIAAERMELIAGQLADLAVKAGVAVDTAEIPGAVSALYSDLRYRDGWLLIFDNAEDPRALQQWLPGGPGHVLITSRNPNWGEIAASVNVAVFASEESVTLLRRRVPGISVAAAEDIAVELGNFPLALAQAASVLSETGLPAAAYLENLARHASETLAEGTPASYSRSLAATVSDAADRLADTDPAAAALLRLSASFGPEPIPASFFTAAAQLPAPLVAVTADPGRLHRSLGRISGYGLARLDQDGMQVHRLVQAIVRDRLSAEQRRDDSDRVAALLVAAAPADTDNPALWPAWATLLPHLLAADPAESDSADLRLLATRALLYLLRRGDSVTAETLGRTLHQRWAERLGPDHVDTLAAATELAFAYRDRGHLTDTRALVEDTLARRRRVLGEDHPDTLRSASDLAVALDELGEYQASRELAEDTLAKRRQVLGDDHPDTLITATSLSGVLNNLGEYQAARELAEDTRPIEFPWASLGGLMRMACRGRRRRPSALGTRYEARRAVRPPYSLPDDPWDPTALARIPELMAFRNASRMRCSRCPRVGGGRRTIFELARHYGLRKHDDGGRESSGAGIRLESAVCRRRPGYFNASRKYSATNTVLDSSPSRHCARYACAKTRREDRLRDGRRSAPSRSAGDRRASSASCRRCGGA